MARYSTGVAFPAFLAASPEAALRFLATAIDKHAPPAVPASTAGQPPHVYWSHSLKFAAGHEALNTMVNALVAFLVSSASEKSAGSQATTAQLLQTAATRLTHHEVWCSLLDAGAANPDSLGRHLLPLLDGSDLLGHYTTRAYAAKLTAALSPVLTESEHERLEQAILRARDPLDAIGEHTQGLIDTLLGQLDGSRVQDATARARLARLIDQGGPPHPPEPPAGSGGPPYGVPDFSFEWSAETGPDLEKGEPLSRAVQRAETDLFETMSGAATDQRAPRERLRESLTALYSALIPTDPAVDQDTFRQAFSVLVRCAERVASDAAVLPGTDLGEMVFEILKAGLPDGAVEDGRAC
jgi:hypothetical protein